MLSNQPEYYNTLILKENYDIHLFIHQANKWFHLFSMLRSNKVETFKIKKNRQKLHSFHFFANLLRHISIKFASDSLSMLILSNALRSNVFSWSNWIPFGSNGGSATLSQSIPSKNGRLFSSKTIIVEVTRVFYEFKLDQSWINYPKSLNRSYYLAYLWGWLCFHHELVWNTSDSPCPRDIFNPIC